jgi:hypothetical protein
MTSPQESGRHQASKGRGGMRWSLIALLALCSGCLAARIRAEASPTLQCPAAQLDIHEQHEHSWMVTGCGRAAICSLAEVSGAEVQCAGGAPSAGDLK